MINTVRTYSFRRLLLTFLPLLAAALCLIIANTVSVSAHPKYLYFPLIGAGSFSNDFYGSRSNGQHNATDIMAPKRTKIIAAVGGKITYVPINQPSWGYMVSIKDAEGFTYDYIHMNNDTPGTDDGNGGPGNAYAPDVKQGANVVKGQFLGYVGDSGNAESTPPHLHFEITAPDGSKVNPYPYLLEAERLSQPSPYPPVGSEILPYGPLVNARVSIASGVFDATLATKVVSGTGKGYSPHVRVLNANGTEISAFYAYAPSFTGGVDVATGDIDGDGYDEIITGTLSGSPHVRVFDKNGVEKASFYAYSPIFTGGVNVSSVDIDGDGKDEILVGTGPGASPHVRVLKPNGSEVLGLYAYNQNYTGGVDVASGDVAGDIAEEIITTPGPGGSAHVRIFTRQGVAIGQGFNAYESYTGYTGGARVSVGNIRKSTTKEEILVGPWYRGGPHFRMLDQSGASLREGYYYESWWTGDYDVAAGDGVSYVSTGVDRRSSIRVGPN